MDNSQSLTYPAQDLETLGRLIRMNDERAVSLACDLYRKHYSWIPAPACFEHGRNMMHLIMDALDLDQRRHHLATATRH